MAEGGTSFENPAFEDPYGDDDTFDDRADETTPFITQTSTPHSGGENIGMHTMQHEASGLPEKSFAETSFGPTIRNTAWEVAKDLFPKMSSSELEVSYDTKGKLQVKMFGAGKKLYRIITTDRGTKQESINKSLPNEIRKALGRTKYEIVEEIRKEEQKKLRQKDLASQTEEKKKIFDEIMTEKEKLEEEINREKNSDHPDDRKIQKLQGRLNTLDSERIKAKKALDESYLAEKDEETLAEELAEAEENEQEVSHVADEIRIVRKHKENLIWRKNQELDYFLHDPNFEIKLDPNLDPEQQLDQQLKQKMKATKMALFKVLNNAIQEDDGQERALERVLGQKRTISDLKAEQLKATRKELTEKMEEAEKIANNEDADPEEKK